MIEHKCVKCGKVTRGWERNEFWQINMGLKGKDPYSSYCKDCFAETVDLDNIETLRGVCEELDIPFIKRDFTLLVNGFRYRLEKRAIVGRYVAKMRLMNFYCFHYEDSNHFNEVRK